MTQIENNLVKKLTIVKNWLVVVESHHKVKKKAINSTNQI